MTDPDGEALARRFHAMHERLYPPAMNTPREWEAMPDGYRQRVSTVFDLLLREGVLSPGHAIDRRLF